MLNNHINKIISITIPILIVIVSCLIYFHRYQENPLFIDEYWFTARSFYYDILFINHNTRDFKWFGDSESGLYDTSQPKVGPYIYGLTLHINGINNIEDKLNSIGYYNREINTILWWKYFRDIKVNTIPNEFNQLTTIILMARKTSIIFLIGTITLIYLLSTKSGGILFGITATILFLSNPLIYRDARLATTDSMQLFFFILNLLLCLAWIKTINLSKPNRFYIISILIGINIALAAGVKTSGIMVLIFFCLTFFILLTSLIKKHKSIHLIIKGFSIAIFTYASIFYILHPYIHQNTLQALWNMYYVRTDQYKTYLSQYPEYTVVNYIDAIHRIIYRTLLPEGSYTNFRIPHLPIDITLFLLGLLFMFRQSRSNKSLRMILVWTGIVAICLILYLKNDWSRYYLPLVSCICLIEAFAISKLIKYYFRAWKYVFE